MPLQGPISDILEKACMIFHLFSSFFIDEDQICFYFAIQFPVNDMSKIWSVFEI